MSNVHSASPVCRHRVSHALGVAGTLIIAVTLLLAGLLYSSYRNTIKREQTNLRNLAAAFAAQTHYATLALDMTLAREAERALRRHHDAGATPASAVRIYTPYRVYVLGPDGQVHATPFPLDHATQPSMPRMGPDEGPQIGIAKSGRNAGHGIITLKRPWHGTGTGSSGAFAIETDASYFERIFDAADLGIGGSVTLLQRNGTMLVRSPTRPEYIGKSMLATPLFQIELRGSPVGAFEAVSSIDGKRRLWGYSTVADYPLVIITGRDLADTLDLWFNWLLIALLAWVFLSAVLLVLAWRIGREASRQATLIERLTTSEHRLQHSYRYLTSILNALATPLWVLDAQRRIVLFNRAFQHFTDRVEQTLAGAEEGAVLDPEGAATRERLYAATAQDGVHSLEAEVRNGAGEPRTMIQLTARLESEDHEVQFVSSLTDITERKQVEFRLAYLSDYDPMTGLANQNQLRRVLKDFLQVAADRGEQVALLLVALERLQEVADLLGHDAGDEAVREVAARLGQMVPHTLCMARVKSNEFGIALSASAGPDPVDATAFRVYDLLSEPVQVRGREFHLSPVVGIALYPQDAGSVNELLRLADIAKHRTRNDSGEPVYFHSASTHTQLDERLLIEEQLRHALARGELTTMYQPKVEIGTGRIVGFEVLLRWENPVLGNVSPVRFIPIAEQTGLIIPIGDWVMRTACMQASSWLREHGIRTKVAVNMSMRQFFHRDLLRSIRDALDGSGLAPDALELEIAESIAMRRVDLVERLLDGIREIGVELSIDDFGTGYSSLAYLKRFPVQRLKIDRAFVHDLEHDSDSAAIVRSIVALGHGLQMRIVAEGVETTSQLDMLREFSCDEYQGFLFSRPLDATAATALLTTACAPPQER
jgi:diguanylate cyclase (GGDEF)-like protein/PAS domain S-box-containing protein